jgi:hypothetical protein
VGTKTSTIGRIRKVGALAVVAMAVLALSTGSAHASSAAPATSEPIPTDDHYSSASASVTASSASIAFVIPGFSWTCSNSQLSGTTPATGLGTFKVTPPTFNDGTGTPCLDNLHYTHAITSSGTWKIGVIDAASDETSTEPNAGDKIKLTMPQNGLNDHVASLGCLLTFASIAPITLKGNYNDQATFTVSTGLTNLGVATSDLVGSVCALPLSILASFTATYTFNRTISDA